MSASGETAFRANSRTGDFPSISTGLGIYTDRTGSLSKIVRSGDQVPGADPGVEFLGIGSFATNASGQVAFRSSLNNFINGSALFSEGSGALERVVTVNDPAPNDLPGLTLSAIFSGFALSDSGETGFEAVLAGPDVDITNDSAFFRGSSGNLNTIIRSGDLIPGSDTSDTIRFRAFGTPTFNSLAQSTFAASLIGTGIDPTNDIGIFSEGSGALAEVVRVADPISNTEPDITFISFVNNKTKTSAAGETVFLATLGVEDQQTGQFLGFSYGIFVSSSGVLKEIAREDDSVPGDDQGLVFSRFNEVVINSLGQVAFNASLSTSFTDGIYATKVDGEIVEVIRDNKLFDVNDDPDIEDLRTVSSSFLFGLTSSVEERGSVFNDHGQLAFFAQFTDGSSGIFVANVDAESTLNRFNVPIPPSALIILGLGLVLIFGTCRFSMQQR